PERDDPQRNEGYPQMSADDAPVSRETSATATAVDLAASPERDAPRNPRQVRTAADHDGVVTYDDETTPLARAVLHQLLAREGRAMSGPVRRPWQTRILVVANQ